VEEPAGLTTSGIWGGRVGRENGEGDSRLDKGILWQKEIKVDYQEKKGPK